MTAKKIFALATIGALSLTLMTGCGGRGDNMVDPYDPGYGYNDPGYNDPGYGNPGYNDPGYGNPGYNDPGYGNPGYGNLPVQLSATVTRKETARGGFLWLKKYVESVTVQVNNPSQQQVQGILRVTFTKGGQAVDTPEQMITLAPGGTQEYTISTTQKADDATAYAESQNGANPGTGNGWGNGGGSNWGGGNGSGWGY